MKITTGEPPKFKPTIIKLESQEEVDLLFAIFNFTPLLDCVRPCANNFVEKMYSGLLPRADSDNSLRKYHSRLRKGLERKDN